MTADLWLFGGLCALGAALVLAARTATAISASWRRTHLDMQVGRVYAGIGWYRGEKPRALGICVCEAAEGNLMLLLLQVAKLCLIVGIATGRED